MRTRVLVLGLFLVLVLVLTPASFLFFHRYFAFCASNGTILIMPFFADKVLNMSPFQVSTVRVRKRVWVRWPWTMGRLQVSTTVPWQCVRVRVLM